MKGHVSIAAFLMTCVFLATSASADRMDGYDYREAHGAENVIRMNVMLEAYERGQMPEADLMLRLWTESPQVMMSLYQDYGKFNECFKIDLVTIQANGVKWMREGQRVFFDESTFRDELGLVRAGREGTLATATMANAILNRAYDRNALVCDMCPANNMCCIEIPPNGTVCQPYTQKRCCNVGPGVPNCTQTQGNNCPIDP